MDNAQVFIDFLPISETLRPPKGKLYFVYKPCTDNY